MAAAAARAVTGALATAGTIASPTAVGTASRPASQRTSRRGPRRGGRWTGTCGENRNIGRIPPSGGRRRDSMYPDASRRTAQDREPVNAPRGSASGCLRCVCLAQAGVREDHFSAGTPWEAAMTGWWQRRRVGRGVAVVAVAVVCLGLVGIPASSAAPAVRAATQPWMNTHLSPQERARLLLQQMTLAEKVDLMTGNQGEAPYAFYNAPIPRLGIPALKMADAGGGVAPRGWSLPGTDGTGDRDALGDGAGATWSAGHLRQFATVVAEEVRETGQNVLLAPDTDIARAALVRPDQREPGRGPVPERRPEQRVRRHPAIAQRDRHAQALHREQPGDEPQRPDRTRS